MPSAVVEIALLALGTYLGVGVLFAVPFAFVGAARIDPDAAGATLGFRLLILPGAVALWPVLLLRWREGGPRAERSPHRDAAGASPEASGSTETDGGGA